MTKIPVLIRDAAPGLDGGLDAGRAAPAPPKAIIGKSDFCGEPQDSLWHSPGVLLGGHHLPAAGEGVGTGELAQRDSVARPTRSPPKGTFCEGLLCHHRGFLLLAVLTPVLSSLGGVGGWVVTAVLVNVAVHGVTFGTWLGYTTWPLHLGWGLRASLGALSHQGETLPTSLLSSGVAGSCQCHR